MKETDCGVEALNQPPPNDTINEVTFYSADQAGTNKDPRLIIVHSGPPGPLRSLSGCSRLCHIGRLGFRRFSLFLHAMPIATGTTRDENIFTPVGDSRNLQSPSTPLLSWGGWFGRKWLETVR